MKPFLTQIHHRQTPLRIMTGSSDVGPVWYTEPLYHGRIGHPIELVAIPDDLNREGVSMAAVMKNAPHGVAARDFVAFMGGPVAQRIFRDYGSCRHREQRGGTCHASAWTRDDVIEP